MSEKKEKSKKSKENKSRAAIPPKRILLAVGAALALTLEALPWSAVLTVSKKGEAKRLYFSSFDPTPFVDRHFGPLFTAVASVILLIAALVYWGGGKGLPFLRVIAGAAFVFSLFSLFGGADRICLLGVLTSLLLLAETALSFLSLPDGRTRK